MPRVAAPRKHRNYYVTDAGGNGTAVKLCLISDGKEAAWEALKKHIEKIRHKKVERQRAGLVLNADTLTLRAVAALYLDHRSKTKPTRLEWETFYLQRLIEWYGDTKIEKLKPPHGDEFKARLLGLDLSPNTVGHYIQMAKAVLNFAIDSDFIAKNPWRKLKAPPKKRRERLVTDGEFERLLAACDNTRRWRGMSKEDVGQTLKDALQLMRATAMRPAVVRELRWDQVFLDWRLIIIVNHKTSDTAEIRKSWKIVLLDKEMEILQRRQKARGSSPYVFTMDGKPWTADAWRNRVARARERAGLGRKDVNGEQICSYHLRHSRISEALYDDKLDLPTVQKIANHSQLATTSLYLHRADVDYVRDVEQGRKRGEANRNPG